jgi:D-aminoacyl-tRNA deacylase
MRVVIQRVNHATLAIAGNIHSSIQKGLLILLGIEEADTQEDINWLCQKINGLRIFSDEDGKMNLDIHQINGELMVVSQFTLFASTKKGNRPSYIRSAKPDTAIPLYETFIKELTQISGKTVATGVFGADMQISLENDGPVTIIIDSQNKE